MYLFFDAVSTQGYLGLYHTQKQEIAARYFAVAGNEGKELPALIDSFLEEQKVSYNDIQNIVCVIGPGSFTGIRMISLVVNTLAYIYPHIFLTGISFFDLYDRYPIIKISSKKDLFVKREKYASIEVVSNEDFVNDFPQGGSCSGNFGDIFGDKNVIALQNYIASEVFSRTELQKHKKLAPMYIKKPNIS